MRIVVKLAVGLALTIWGCWIFDLPFGYLTMKQAFGVFLFTLAGSIMNMKRSA